MRLVVKKEALRRIVQWTRLALFAAAVSLLGYCGFVLADAWIFQRQESHNLERLIHDRRAASDSAPERQSPASPKGRPAAAASGLVGRIEIPRLGLSVVVVEGSDETALRRAVGHIPGTALPGEAGNVGIAGHRDTFFRPLRNIHPNDIITLTTSRGEYRYRVVSMQVVRPDYVAVLDTSRDQILTLVTCHPFYFVGSAPDRFIVRAERVAG